MQIRRTGKNECGTSTIEVSAFDAVSVPDSIRKKDEIEETSEIKE